MRPRIPAMAALAIVALGSTPAAAACLPGPYKPGAVPKHPMTPMHAAKPSNPLEETLPRCTAAAAHERGERFVDGTRDGTVMDD